MKCITEVYTEKGIFEKSDNLLINRKFFLGLKPNSHTSIKKAVINIIARASVEASGLQLPVLKIDNDLEECCIKIQKDKKIESKIGIIKIENNQIIITAHGDSGIDKISKYLSYIYPYISLDRKIELKDIKKEYEKILKESLNISKLVIDENDEVTNIEVSSENGNTYNGIKILNKFLEKNEFDEINIKKHSRQDKTLNNDIGEFFSANGIYKNTINNYNFDFVDAKVLLRNNFSDNELEAASKIVSRIWLETFGMNYPVVITEDELNEKSSLIEILESDSEYCELELKDLSLTIKNNSNNLKKSAESFFYNFEYLKEIKSRENEDIKELIEGILSSENDLGQIVTALLDNKKEDLEIITSNYGLIDYDKKKLNDYYYRKRNKNLKIRRLNDSKLIYSDNYIYNWEGKDFLNLFEKEFLSKIQKNDLVNIEAVVSEDKKVRLMIEEKLSKKIREKGAQVEKIKVYRSLKQGLCWIQEDIIPIIKKMNSDNQLDRIIIKFSPVVDTYNKWSSEENGLPDYSPHKNNENHIFDLPIRWLQELYPVDEIIEKETGFSKNKVFFEAMEEGSHTYEIELINKNKVFYKGGYDVRYIKKPYMMDFKEIGSVNVTTGWFRGKINKKIKVDSRIETDIEKIWETLENDIMPKLKNYVFKKDDYYEAYKKQPFFNCLELLINISEIDYDLGIKEERMSTIESLQEDIYFYILDYFKMLGERKIGKAYDNIGLILPIIKISCCEDTEMKVNFYDNYDKEISYKYGMKKFNIQKYDTQLKNTKIKIKENNSMEYKTQVISKENNKVKEKIKIMKELLEENIINFKVDKDITLKFMFDNRTEEIILKKTKKTSNNLITEIEKEKLLKNIIGYDDYIKLIEYYSSKNDIKASRIGTTYKGRKIYALELVKLKEEAIYSQNKILDRRKTYLINNRHHGNEITGTNSSFRLIDKIINEADKNNYLLNTNIVVLPYENIDGGEIHYMLQKDNPKWIYHIARFNSVGFEFRKDYFKDESIYGEAKALPKLWEKWWPDVITDNHGVESHEFYMQFSGYVSPWYKGFWIPKAPFYAYFWYKDSLKNMKELAEEIQENTSVELNKDEKFKEENKYWEGRFSKYAEEWMKNIYDTERYDGIIYHWIKKEEGDDDYNFVFKYPEITTLWWTTEVPDETVLGENLEFNSNIHLKVDLSVIELLEKIKPVVKREIIHYNDSLINITKRERPLKID